jgi:hypothetical protein
MSAHGYTFDPARGLRAHPRPEMPAASEPRPDPSGV